MSELATRPQIRKLYAVLRNRGLDPKEHVKKLKEEKGVASLNKFTKIGMSELIDQFEAPKPTPNSTTKPTLNSNSTPKPKPTTTTNRKAEVAEDSEVSEEDKARLNQIDTLFNECLAKATNTVRRELGGTERPQATTIIEIAKLYFDEVRKGAERG